MRKEEEERKKREEEEERSRSLKEHDRVRKDREREMRLRARQDEEVRPLCHGLHLHRHHPDLPMLTMGSMGMQRCDSPFRVHGAAAGEDVDACCSVAEEAGSCGAIARGALQQAH